MSDRTTKCQWHETEKLPVIWQIKWHTKWKTKRRAGVVMVSDTLCCTHFGNLKCAQQGKGYCHYDRYGLMYNCTLYIVHTDILTYRGTDRKPPPLFYRTKTETIDQLNEKVNDKMNSASSRHQFTNNGNNNKNKNMITKTTKFTIYWRLTDRLTPSCLSNSSLNSEHARTAF